MKVTIVIEQRFYRTGDGTIWTSTMFPYSFWTRYLVVFDFVNVIARVQDVEAADPSWSEASGKNIAFNPLPYYVGPMQYLRRFYLVRQALLRAIESSEAVVLRVPSALCQTVEAELRRKNRPFGVEVVGDPYDVFAVGAVRHPLRALFRIWFARRTRTACRFAAAAAYVTKNRLQQRYPASQNAFTTHYSSIDLRSDAFLNAPRESITKLPTTLCICVGTLDQLYKAQDVLIESVQICVNRGIDLRLQIVGEGKYRKQLQEEVCRLGLAHRIEFVGQIKSGSAVRALLDKADLFVLPSKQEGLPRAMIEAMARGMPCIGSTVGGIPELLPVEDMVSPGDPEELASKIIEVITDPGRMEAMSARNLATACDYRDEILSGRRREFYAAVRDRTGQWLDDGNAR